MDALGARHEEIAVLEGCSISGASLFTGVPIGVGTPITLGGGDEEFQGTVRHSVPAPNGYLAGVTIGELRNYVPEHLLDLSRLIYPEKP